jgi:hypothetical protein
MTSDPFIDIRALWRIPPLYPKPNPEVSRLKSICSKAAETKGPPLASNILQEIVRISDPNVIDISPSFFWQAFLHSWSTEQDGLVATIISDLVRDRMEEKSLPLYLPFKFAAHGSSYLATLLEVFPYSKKWDITIIFRNELGTSMPLSVNQLNCRNLFSYISRDPLVLSQVNEISWIGFVYKRHD